MLKKGTYYIEIYSQVNNSQNNKLLVLLLFELIVAIISTSFSQGTKSSSSLFTKIVYKIIHK